MRMENTLIVQKQVLAKTVDFPAIPDGDITNLRISKSEKLIRLTVGTSKSTNNIYVYNLETKNLKTHWKA
jgi:hypothetical protein